MNNADPTMQHSLIMDAEPRKLKEPRGFFEPLVVSSLFGAYSFYILDTRFYKITERFYILATNLYKLEEGFYVFASHF